MSAAMKGAAALLISVLACAPSFAAADGPYALKWTPKEGDTLTYANEGALSLSKGDATLKGKTIQKVIKVDPDGTYSVQGSSSEGVLTYLGEETKMPDQITVTLYRPSGEVVGITGEDTSPASVRSANLTSFRRPDKPVNIGDTWQMEIKSDPKSGVIGVKGLYKLEAEEKIGAFDALRVTANVKESDGPTVGSVDATYWINADDGSLVKYSAKWSNVSFAGAPTPLTGSMTMTRVSTS